MSRLTHLHLLQPKDYVESLACLNCIQNAKVFVILNDEFLADYNGAAATDFVAVYSQDDYGSKPMPPLNEQLALKVTTKLFRRFFENASNARLRSLEVSFKYKEIFDRAQTNDAEHPIRVRQLEGQGAPNPLEGGFTIESPRKWLSWNTKRKAQYYPVLYKKGSERSN